MKFLDIPGRILFAVPMMMSGFVHFSKTSVIARLVPDYFPFREGIVYFTGAAFIFAGISILIKRKTKISSALLGLMILCFALFVHMGGFLRGNPLASSMFIKDLALAGGALYMSSTASD